MLGNILKLRHLTAYDVMVPRADIAGVDIMAPLDEVIAVTSGKGHSRVPVYRGNLDDVVGFVHIKDVLAAVKSERKFSLAGMTRACSLSRPRCGSSTCSCRCACRGSTWPWSSTSSAAPTA